MAPKRSRVIASSSSDSDSSGRFTGNKFISPEALAEYNRLMTKNIIRERGFLPVSTDGALVPMIEGMDWVTVCEAPIPVPLSIVREFYANAKAERNGYSVVRGLTVDYTPAAIRRVLEIPPRPEGAEDWVQKTRDDVDLESLIVEICVPGTVWTCRRGTTEQVSFPASALNKYARAWNLFLCANLSPNLHAHVVTVERAILLYGILNEGYLDLGLLIHQNMVKFMRGVHSGAIPHGSVVTKLCSAVGIRWPEDEPLQLPSAPIDSAAIARLVEWPGGLPDPRGLGYTQIFGGGRQHPPPREHRVPRADRPGPSRPPLADTSGLSGTHYRRLIRRIDASHDINRRFAEDLTSALDSVYLTQGIQVPWPTFGAHTVYPPADTPPEEGDLSDD